MARVKLKRQQIIGQWVLGKCNIAQPPIYRVPKHKSYATNVRKSGPWLADRSDFDPFYSTYPWLGNPQLGKRVIDALGNHNNIPCPYHTGFAATVGIAANKTLIKQISGAVMIVDCYGNSNPTRAFDVKYGTVSNVGTFSGVIPPTQRSLIALLPDVNFVANFNASGGGSRQDWGTIATDPIDWIFGIEVDFW